MANENIQIETRRISQLSELDSLSEGSFTVVAVGNSNKKFDLSKIKADVDLTEITEIKDKLDEHTEQLEQHTEKLNDLDGNLKIKEIDTSTLQLTNDGRLSVIGGGTGGTSDVNRAYVDSELAKKADKDHTHDGYLTEQDISSLATKDELSTKADKVHEHGEYAQKSELEDKVDKVEGMGLSSNDFTDVLKDKLDGIAEGAEVNVQVNWEETDEDSDAFIKNKPDLTLYATEAYVDEKIVQAGTGGTVDLSGYVTEIELQDELNKKVNSADLKTVATSGSYTDLTNTPIIPTKVSDLTNDSGFITTIPTEYITEEELLAKGYLTEHQSLDEYAKTSDIPTKTSELTNDSNFLTTIPSEYITETELTPIKTLLGEETLKTTSPTVVGGINELKDITDEVVAARENATTTYDSLDARLDDMDRAIAAASGTDMTLYATKQYVNEEDKKITDQIGDLSTLNTTEKTTLVGAINELSGKSGVTILTQQEYDGLADKDENTLFYISDKQNMIINEKVVNERNVNIKSMSIEPKIAEMGSTVSSVMVSFKLDGEPETIKVNNVEATGTSHTLTGTFTANTDIILDVTLNSGRVVTGKCELEFANGIYVGVSDSTVYDGALINSLEKVLSNHKSGEKILIDVESYLYVIDGGLERQLADTRGRDIVVDCAEGKYVYYALPSRLGVPQLSVNGIVGGFMLASTIQFTNGNGYTEPYDIYRSEHHSLGTITLLAM